MAPPDLEARCNCLSVRKAARYMTAIYDQALVPADLRSTQFSILGHLASSGPIGIKRLAHAMTMDRTTLAVNLKPLKRRKLIEVTVPPSDRRRRIVQITPEGRRQLQRATPYWRDAQKTFEVQFTPRQSRQIRDLLSALIVSGPDPWEKDGGAP